MSFESRPNPRTTVPATTVAQRRTVALLLDAVAKADTEALLRRGRLDAERGKNTYESRCYRETVTRGRGGLDLDVARAKLHLLRLQADMPTAPLTMSTATAQRILDDVRAGKKLKVGKVQKPKKKHKAQGM